MLRLHRRGLVERRQAGVISAGERRDQPHWQHEALPAFRIGGHRPGRGRSLRRVNVFLV